MWISRQPDPPFSGLVTARRWEQRLQSFWPSDGPSSCPSTCQRQQSTWYRKAHGIVVNVGLMLSPLIDAYFQIIFQQYRLLR